MLERSKVPPSELLLSPGTQVFKPLEVPFHIRSHDSDSNADSLVTCHFTTFDKLKLIKRVAKVSIRLVWDHKACTTGYRCDLTKGWTYRGQAPAWASHGSNGCMIGKENFRTWSQHTHSHCCVSSKPRAMHHLDSEGSILPANHPPTCATLNPPTFRAHEPQDFQMKQLPNTEPKRWSLFYCMTFA